MPQRQHNRTRQRVTGYSVVICLTVFLLCNVQVYSEDIGARGFGDDTYTESYTTGPLFQPDEAVSLPDDDTLLTKIAFASCSHQLLRNQVWDAIEADDPQLYVWTGDAIYGDIKYAPLNWKVASAEQLRATYESMKHRPDYVSFRKRFPIIGVWDDHDYGLNNGNSSMITRDDSQKIFLDFVDEPMDSARRSQKGIYWSYTYGPVGKRVKVILLDVRFHADSVWDGLKRQGDLLGEEQWKWFENEISDSDAQVHVVVSGIQVIPPDKPIQEKWGLWPLSRERLFKLFQKHQPSGALLLSGDIHYAEVHTIDVCLPRDQSGSQKAYRVGEVTSSGMSHTCMTQAGKACPVVVKHTMTSQYLRRGPYLEFNYGMIEIDWDKRQVVSSVRDVNGTTRMQHTVSFATDTSQVVPVTTDSPCLNPDDTASEYDQSMWNWSMWPYEVFESVALWLSRVIKFIKPLVIVWAVHFMLQFMLRTCFSIPNAKAVAALVLSLGSIQLYLMQKMQFAASAIIVASVHMLGYACGTRSTITRRGRRKTDHPKKDD
jgi:alkaline phosphatase D